MKSVKMITLFLCSTVWNEVWCKWINYREKCSLAENAEMPAQCLWGANPGRRCQVVTLIHKIFMHNSLDFVTRREERLQKLLQKDPMPKVSHLIKLGSHQSVFSVPIASLTGSFYPFLCTCYPIIPHCVISHLI